MNTIDPICGMKGTIAKHNYLFCSTHCIEKYEQQKGIQKSSKPKKNNKRIAYLLIFFIVFGGIVSRRFNVMKEFMGGFFIIVSILKLLDLQGFVKAYAKYDIIAIKYNMWGWIYPFIELAIGVSFLISFEIQRVARATLILMIIGTIGVARKLMKNEKFQCACLGTKLNVPLTKLTLVEDLLMGAMSIIILLG